MSKKKSNYLEKIPQITDGLVYEQKDELVIIQRENKGLYNRLAQKVFKRPVVTNVELDAFGSYVFLQIDGTRDIIAIGDLVKEHFGEKAEPLYERLSRFIELLHMNGFVSFQKEDR